MSRAELKKAFVIDKFIHHQFTTAQAAQVLGFSPRQVLRLKAKVQQEESETLTHGNRGRALVHTIAKEVRQQIIRVYTERIMVPISATSHSLPARITVQVRQTMLVVYQLCVFPTEGGEL